MSRRIAALQSALQPSARAWTEQQARLESQKQTPDPPSVEAAVYNRFPALNTRGSSAKASDINTLVAIVMMQEAKDAETDLQQMMAQVQAINNAKQKMRDLLSQTQLEVKSNRSLDAKAIARRALCKSLPSTLNEISSGYGENAKTRPNFSARKTHLRRRANLARTTSIQSQFHERHERDDAAANSNGDGPPSKIHRNTFQSAEEDR